MIILWSGVHAIDARRSIARSIRRSLSRHVAEIWPL